MNLIRPYLFIVICFVFSGKLLAQKQFNNWYFGNTVGLNFNLTPPAVLTDGRANSVEGCAAISDINGNLLFYTNGSNVMNRRHQVMTNGESIAGDYSSTSNTIIVPLSGNDSIYYLFTIGATQQVFKGFRYSIINIKRSGGLGEVTQKNVFIEEESYEKMAAVRHCNKKDVWIMVRPWDTDQYRAYLLTSSGLSAAPVVSRTGLLVGGYFNNGIGMLKFSVDGKKLAAAHSFENNCVELMDFDNITGVVSNPIIFKPNIDPPENTGVYGVEFSPNSRLLYVSAYISSSNPSTLYQFDITSMNASAILLSKQVIAEDLPWPAGALQTGPDKKIYFSMWRDTSISVIENPDVYGPGCNFKYNEILLSTTITEPSQFGLPSYIASDLDEQFMPYDFFRLDNDCRNFTVSFQINKITGIDSVTWDFGDGEQSTSLNPVHEYDREGSYSVKLIVYSVGCLY